MAPGIDWTGYTRVHSDRRNLLIHAIAVPLFVAAIVLLAVCLVLGAYIFASLSLVGAMTAVALQAWGHTLEVHAPEPFSGPGNFLKRWFGEQFVVFPVFFLTGRWWRQFRASARGAGDAA